jgi:light-harvesting protein B-800-850 alpha chain
MIYGKLWCVVKPSTGIPLFLSAVAVSSFMVHYMLLTHTTWLKQYYNGPVKVAAVETPVNTAAALPPLIVAAASPAAKP